MGRYIDWVDVTNKYKDWPKAADATLAAASFIPQAEAEVDGRLAVKYSVPFSPVPYIVQDLCCDVAYYKATIRQEGSEIVKKYIDERSKAIIDGTLVLTTSAGALTPTGNTAWASNSYHSSFGMDSEINWHVSTVAVQDIQDARGQL